MNTDAHVPFSVPYTSPQALGLIEKVLESSHHSGDGEFGDLACQMLTDLVPGGTFFLTPSCTDALELALMASGVGPGDEVIVPSFGFTSPAIAALRTGARLRFSDACSSTLSTDPESILRLINGKTRAVVSLAYGGHGEGLGDIRNICDAHGLLLVEDAAHSLGAAIDANPLGSFGDLSAFSFHATKNLSCGEGGALLVNQEAYLESIHVLREKGTNRRAFSSGKVSKYRWVGPGSSFLLPEVLAAILVANLSDWEVTQSHRTWIWNLYHSELQDWSRAHQAVLPPLVSSVINPAHVFFLICPTNEFRDMLMRHCNLAGISCVSHYEPLNSSPFATWNHYQDSCPVTEELSQRLIRLPLFATMSRHEVELVIATVTAFSPEN